MSRVLLVSLAMHRLLLNTVRPPVSVPLLPAYCETSCERPPPLLLWYTDFLLNASRLLRLNSARGLCVLAADCATRPELSRSTHLKHVAGSRYAPWCSGPCASVSHCCSAGTSGLDRACIRRRLLGPSGLIHILTLWHIFWNICTPLLFSLFCLSCCVTLGCFVNSFVLACCWLCSSLFTGSRVPSLAVLFTGSRDPSLAVSLSSRPFGACFINQIQ